MILTDKEKLKVYRHVRNFLHNELGLTREWITALVQKQVQAWIVTYVEENMRKVQFDKVFYEIASIKFSRMVESEVKAQFSDVIARMKLSFEKEISG